MVALVITWPLARDLAHNVAGGYGDPLFTAWVLAWDATHLFARGWWNANIFAPHPLALAYSDHLVAEALQVLPFYALTRNPILVYNLALLSTFTLSGLGAYLLVRELTGDRTAAFVGGLAYAFTPYRIGALPHLTVLSSAWMPFTLFAFRRYFDTRRVLPLACAVLAWSAQNLSSGYYLLFFAPAIAIYLLWEISRRRLWRDARTLAGVALACAATVFVTLPFVLPYLELRELGFEPRSLAETQQFSADVYAYLTSDVNLWLSGSVWRAWPKAEGSLFPGLTISALALFAASRRVRPIVLAPILVIMPLLFGVVIRMPGVRIASLSRALVVVFAAAIVMLIASRRARTRVIDWLQTPAGCFATITLFAIVMSFGPDVRAHGRVVLDTNVYALFYRFFPGYDGLRVPARFVMIAALGLAVMCGLALAEIRRRSIAIVAAVLIVAEALAAPLPLNQNSTEYVRAGLAPLPPLERVVPPVYRYIASLPPDAVVMELPLGEPAFDLRYMFFSTTHWRRLVNGYSGGFPPEYVRLDQTLQDALIRPERAAAALRALARPTHVVVHEGYFAGDRGPRISAWVRSLGGFELATFGRDRVFVVP